ncbi:MAG: phosphoenolpyruvate carboxykinase (ATP) [Candidatus Devosia euplotis]|nr:phosphoenolpyruvate carboxykinase (ATP) [Candidatus Devosia euplotis]
MSSAQFEVLLADTTAALDGLGLFRQDLLAGADPRHQYGVTVLTPSAWHALFIRNLLIRPDEMVPTGAHPTAVTIVHTPISRPIPPAMTAAPIP